MRAIAERYVADTVNVVEPNDLRDIGCSPYYGQILERLILAIKPDETAGESPELPRYESFRPEGSTADVDFWTSKDVRQTTKSATPWPSR